MSRKWKLNPPRTGGGNRDQILDNIDRELRRLNDATGGGATEATALLQLTELQGILADTADLAAMLTALQNIDTDTNELALIKAELQKLVAADPVLQPIGAATDQFNVTVTNGGVVTLSGLPGGIPPGAIGALVQIETADVRFKFGVDPTPTLGTLVVRRGLIELGALGDSDVTELNDFRVIGTSGASANMNVIYYKVAP